MWKEILAWLACVRMADMHQKERKVKCDKLDPCTNCCSSGITCVPIYRNRLPRGRHARPRNNSDVKSHAGMDGGVNERLRRLEALVDRRGGGETGDPPSAMGNSTAAEQARNRSEENGVRPSSSTTEETSPTMRRPGPHRQQSSDFWWNLVEDVSRIHLLVVKPF